MTRSELQPYVEAIVCGQNHNARTDAASALLALFPATEPQLPAPAQSDNPFAKGFVAPDPEENAPAAESTEGDAEEFDDNV